MSRELHVYSNPTIDVIGGGARAGGPGLYAALAARILGFEARVYGAIGGDGAWVLEEYTKRGARIGSVQMHLDDKTTRMRIEYRGPGRLILVEELGPLINTIPARSPRMVSPVIGEFEANLLHVLARGAFVDVQGVVRVRKRGLLELTHNPICARLLEDAKLVHGDARELGACTNSSSIPEMLEKLVTVSYKVSIVLSLGYRGALYLENGEVYHIPAWGPETTDPTGMGDVMLASMVYLNAYEGLSLLDAVRVATVVCGLHAEKRYEPIEPSKLEKLAPAHRRVDVAEAKQIINEQA